MYNNVGILTIKLLKYCLTSTDTKSKYSFLNCVLS